MKPFPLLAGAALCVVVAPHAVSQSHVHTGLPATSVAAGGWLEPWNHRHQSPRGAPYVHAFGLEPAFFGRDLFFDVRRTDLPGERELEVEVELEWAWTRRLGVVVEAPWIAVDEVGGGARDGLGDLAVAPRALLVETEPFLLAAGVHIGVPTGDEDRGFGSGEVALAPSLAAWADLGNWIAIQGQVELEYGVESGDTELAYGCALTWSFLTAGHGDGDPEHAIPGRTSLIAECTARTGLDGPNESRTTAEVLVGVSYAVSGRCDVRGGYQFPVGGREDIDHGVVFGVVIHF